MVTTVFAGIDMSIAIFLNLLRSLYFTSRFERILELTNFPAAANRLTLTTPTGFKFFTGHNFRNTQLLCHFDPVLLIGQIENGNDLPILCHLWDCAVIRLGIK